MICEKNTPWVKCSIKVNSFIVRSKIRGATYPQISLKRVNQCHPYFVQQFVSICLNLIIFFHNNWGQIKKLFFIKVYKILQTSVMPKIRVFTTLPAPHTHFAYVLVYVTFHQWTLFSGKMHNCSILINDMWTFRTICFFALSFTKHMYNKRSVAITRKQRLSFKSNIVAQLTGCKPFKICRNHSLGYFTSIYLGIF